MKKHLLLTLFACTCFSLQAQITETATEAVKNMGLGWNLGNTLEANNGNNKPFTDAGYWGIQGLESETCWGQVYTHPELFEMLKKGGFGAIRVPVTWYNHMGIDGKVNAAWMKRVHEVVDFVIDNGLYCIINVHHDNGASSDKHTMWLQAEEDNYKVNKERYEYLWKQIAEEFKSYNEKLLFEAYNEMLDGQSTWNEPKKASSYNAINSYAQSFVDVVRATGGNNETRNLIVSSYAAANGENAVKNLKLPTDKATGHTIVEVHAYPNFFEWSNPTKQRTMAQIKGEIDYILKTLQTYVLNKGVPAIIGEWSSYGVDNGAGKTDYDVRKDMFFEFCQYFLSQAKAKDIAMFYWMGISDGALRYDEDQKKSFFSQADLAELLAKTFHGDSFKGEYPTYKVESKEVLKEEKAISWGNGITISSELFKAIKGAVKIDITFKVTGNDDDIQFFDANWKNHPTFIVDGKTITGGDFNPSKNGYEANATNPHQVTFTFPSTADAELRNSGLIIHGNNITLCKVVVSSLGSNGIERHEATLDTTPMIIDLSGNRVQKLGKGMFIRNGQKVYVK